MIGASAFLLAATLSSSDAIAVLLNSRAATSATRYAAAEKVVRREARAGKPLQQFVWAVTTDDAALRKRYLEAARPKIDQLARTRGNPLAWYLLWCETKTPEMLKNAADGGNVQALNAYGTRLVEMGLDASTPSNAVVAAFAEANRCFSRAAAKKDPNAYINLGTCFLRGIGCKVDLALAHQCFRAAAEAGHPEGMDYVSAGYELGHGVSRDHRKATVWMMKARALRGDKAAEEWLRK